MSKELVSSIDIAAPAERVWEVLVDFAAFPAWNPFITQAEGRLEVGGRLTLRMQPVGGSAVILRPTVVEVVDGQRLRWRGRLGVPRLFDATICSPWSRVLPGHDSNSKSSSPVCSCPSFSGRWTEARCRRSRR
jgi:hypothetical protein